MQFVRKKVITKLPIIEINADTIIFEEGWSDYKMFLILEGRVQLYNEVESGVEVEVAVLKEHQFFGELEMYTHRPRATSAKMITPVKLLVIRTPIELEEFINDNQWLTGKIMETMSERLTVASDLLAKKISSELTPNFAEPVLETTQDNTIRRVVRY